MTGARDLGRWADELAAEFAWRVGRPPAGVWAAPGRVNLIGEHLDYNGGLVLPAAIDRHVVLAAAPRDDGGVAGWSRQTDDPGWLAYPQGVQVALRDSGVPVGGVDLLVDSGVPLGGGLSSSAALSVAAALALLDLAGRDVAPLEVAKACQRAENDYVGAPTGLMDQVACLLGRAGHAVLFDCRTLAVEPVPLRLGDCALVVIDTRVQHATAEGGYADRRRACEEAARRLGVEALRDATEEQVARLDEPLRRRARHVVTELARVEQAVALLRDGRLREVGALLDASHASLRDDFEVSCPELDVAVDTARDAGAWGARLTGAGFGGCALALVPSERLAAVAQAVEAAFAERGWRHPRTFAVQPADNAHRVR